MENDDNSRYRRAYTGAFASRVVPPPLASYAEKKEKGDRRRRRRRRRLVTWRCVRKNGNENVRDRGRIGARNRVGHVEEERESGKRENSFRPEEYSLGSNINEYTAEIAR